MKIKDVVKLLMEGKLGNHEQQQAIAELISQLCELLDGTVDREIEHLKEIEELKKQIKYLHRMNAINKHRK